MGIFEIIGPVMVGPSSSHTAGAVQLGNFARLALGVKPIRAEIGLHGSFHDTGEGHGTHLAILAGILGLAPDDERIPSAKQLAIESGLNFSFNPIELGEVHPNSARIKLTGVDGESESSITVSGSSIGGGKILIWQLDQFQVALDGTYPSLLLFYPDHCGVVAEVSTLLAKHQLNIAAMKVHRTNRGGAALMMVELDQHPESEILQELLNLSDISRVQFIPDLEGSVSHE